MRHLIRIGNMAIYGIIATILLSSVVYAEEGAIAESDAIANAFDGGEATSIVETEVNIVPDGDGYKTTTDAIVNLQAIGESDAHGDAFGEGTSPADPDGKKANARVKINGDAIAFDDESEADLSGEGIVSVSTKDDTATLFSDLRTQTIGRAIAEGSVDTIGIIK